MKKIMFNDKYGLTAAVLEGRKTMTRRLLPQDKINGRWDYNSYYDYCLKCKRLGKNEITWEEWLILHHGKYKVGEEVAVAESYHSLNKSGYVAPEWLDHYCEDSAGYENKMFVRADLMPHHIRITNVRVERLQDISDEDCLKEGVLKYRCIIGFAGEYVIKVNNKPLLFHTPREAFAALIDRVSGKGTWNSNPWVFVYSFEFYAKGETPCR